MGNFACCNKPENEEDKNLERKDLDNQIKNNNADIIILSEQPTTIKYTNYESSNNNNEKNKENLKKEEKIRKIQKKYRSFILKKKFQELKPIISQKASNFLEQFYQKCAQGGDIAPDDDFSEEGWKEYYPPGESFFLYQKGKVFENQIRIKNPDDEENLEIYEGETNMNNLKHGFGTLTTPRYVLKGNWRNDQFTGWGRKSMRNGDTLEGKFINGELNGKGIFKNKDGTYVGDFENSVRSGKGELTTKNYHYMGDFKNNKLNGIGIIDFSTDGHRYEGQFENNEITGKGVYKWKNGEIYEGQMKKGKMDGYGKYIFEDGKIYEGEYVNGIKQGRGKLIYPSNIIYEGLFENGVPHGEGFYTKNGHTSKVMFNNGEFVKVIA
jgi:hypothetical protein